MKKIFALVLFSSVISVSKGQTNYVILTNGDSLAGQVKIMRDDKLDRVRVESPAKKNTFTALQVRKTLIDGITYTPVKHDQSFILMKLIKKGYLSLYAFRPEGIQTWDGLYLYKMDGNGMDLPNLAFKKFLSDFLQECPEIQMSIMQGEFGKRDINEIVERYNICIELRNEGRHPTANRIVIDSEKTKAVKKLVSTLESENFETKKDALSILNDILEKIYRNEAIPNYLTEALKSNLASTSHAKDLEELLSTLKK